MRLNAGWISIVIGLALTSTACLYLFYMFPRISKKQDNAISLVALRLSFLLGTGGVIMLFLGILFLMDKLPW
jgi:ABC-type nickel/cobalt efflux system permease component RcnA